MRTSIITLIVMCALWIYIKGVAIIKPEGDIWITTAVAALGGMFICLIILIVSLIRALKTK